MNFTTIFKAVSSARAQGVRARLEAANFHPFVPDELSAFGSDAMALGSSGIRIQVPEADAADAREFLESKDENLWSQQPPAATP
jgi:hypothetical protein